MVYQLSNDHSLIINKLGGERFNVSLVEHCSGNRLLTLETFSCDKDFLAWEYGDELTDLL